MSEQEQFKPEAIDRFSIFLDVFCELLDSGDLKKITKISGKNSLSKKLSEDQRIKYKKETLHLFLKDLIKLSGNKFDFSCIKIRPREKHRRAFFRYMYDQKKSKFTKVANHAYFINNLGVDELLVTFWNLITEKKLRKFHKRIQVAEAIYDADYPPFNKATTDSILELLSKLTTHDFSFSTVEAHSRKAQLSSIQEIEKIFKRSSEDKERVKTCANVAYFFSTASIGHLIQRLINLEEGWLRSKGGETENKAKRGNEEINSLQELGEFMGMRNYPIYARSSIPIRLGALAKYAEFNSNDAELRAKTAHSTGANLIIDLHNGSKEDRERVEIGARIALKYRKVTHRVEKRRGKIKYPKELENTLVCFCDLHEAGKLKNMARLYEIMEEIAKNGSKHRPRTIIRYSAVLADFADSEWDMSTLNGTKNKSGKNGIRILYRYSEESRLLVEKAGEYFSFYRGLGMESFLRRFIDMHKAGELKRVQNVTQLSEKLYSEDSPDFTEEGIPILILNLTRFFGKDSAEMDKKENKNFKRVLEETYENDNLRELLLEGIEYAKYYSNLNLEFLLRTIVTCEEKSLLKNISTHEDMSAVLFAQDNPPYSEKGIPPILSMINNLRKKNFDGTTLSFISEAQNEIKDEILRIYKKDESLVRTAAEIVWDHTTK